MKKYSKLFLIAALTGGAAFFAACASAGNETAAPPNPVAANASEPIKITVATNFEPKSVEVKKGQPVTLAFFRKDEKNCGDEVVFPKLGIRKKLPVGETVSVELTPQETGEIAFTCGMDMMRGKLIVSQ
jgi:plastocyanin domain-containing protein